MIKRKRIKKKSKKRKNPERLRDLPLEYYIPLKDCISRHIYYTSGRGISFGVYKNDGVFIGLRDSELTNEYHWDLGAPYGTVQPQLDLEILPEYIKVSFNGELLEYLKYIKAKYWPLIYPEEEIRKKKFHDQIIKEEKLAKEEFGPVAYYCSNCENVTEKNWAKCPKCKALSGFGNQLYLRLKDNTLWKDYDKKK